MLNEANRVQITVLEVVKNGTSGGVNGSGLALDGFPGLLGQVREDGADVVSKLWNATLSGVSSYMQGLANANTTMYGQGVATISQPGADLGWSVLGNLAQAFLMPPAQQQTVQYGDRRTEATVAEISTLADRSTQQKIQFALAGFTHLLGSLPIFTKSLLSST